MQQGQAPNRAALGPLPSRRPLWRPGTTTGCQEARTSTPGWSPSLGSGLRAGSREPGQPQQPQKRRDGTLGSAWGIWGPSGTTPQSPCWRRSSGIAPRSAGCCPRRGRAHPALSHARTSKNKRSYELYIRWSRREGQGCKSRGPASLGGEIPGREATRGKGRPRVPAAPGSQAEWVHPGEGHAQPGRGPHKRRGHPAHPSSATRRRARPAALQ